MSGPPEERHSEFARQLLRGHEQVEEALSGLEEMAGESGPDQHADLEQLLYDYSYALEPADAEMLRGMEAELVSLRETLARQQEALEETVGAADNVLAVAREYRRYVSQDEVEAIVRSAREVLSSGAGGPVEHQ